MAFDVLKDTSGTIIWWEITPEAISSWVAPKHSSDSSVLDSSEMTLDSSEESSETARFFVIMLVGI